MKLFALFGAVMVTVGGLALAAPPQGDGTEGPEAGPAGEGSPSLAEVIDSAERADPFGGWMAAGLIAPGPTLRLVHGAGEDLAQGALAWGLVPAGDGADAAPAASIVETARSLGTGLAELLARGDAEAPAVAPEAGGESLLPDWAVSGFDSVRFDLAGLLKRLGQGLFALPDRTGPGEAERAIANAPETAPKIVPEPEVADSAEADAAATPARPAPRAVEPAGRIVALETPAQAPRRPTTDELTERAPRSLGVVNLSSLIQAEPAPESKVLSVTAGRFDQVLGDRLSGETASLPEAAPSVPDEEPAAAAVVDSAEAAPAKTVPDETAPADSDGGFVLAALVPGPVEPQPAERPRRRVKATPPRPRLRPFHAADHGIRPIPGSSAASLAHMLEAVSTRPAGSGFGPVLTAAERRMSFGQLLNKADVTSKLFVAPGSQRRGQKRSSRGAKLPLTGARELRRVLTTEGAYLD